MKCTIDSRALSNFTATTIHHFWPDRAKTMLGASSWTMRLQFALLFPKLSKEQREMLLVKKATSAGTGATLEELATSLGLQRSTREI
jgi:hypothetical protein